MRNILLAFDGSDHSRRALKYIVDYAADSAKPLHVHVLNVQHEPVIYGEYVTSEMVQDLTNNILAKSRSILGEAATVLQMAGIEHETHAAQGNVAEQINDTVKRLGCDTIVMGTRGHGSFTGMLLGSVANRVIHEVSVPILLVK